MEWVKADRLTEGPEIFLGLTYTRTGFRARHLYRDRSVTYPQFGNQMIRLFLIGTFSWLKKVSLKISDYLDYKN